MDLTAAATSKLRFNTQIREWFECPARTQGFEGEARFTAGHFPSYASLGAISSSKISRTVRGTMTLPERRKKASTSVMAS